MYGAGGARYACLHVAGPCNLIGQIGSAQRANTPDRNCFSDLMVNRGAGFPLNRCRLTKGAEMMKLQSRMFWHISLYAVAALIPVHAHYPHDVQEYIALSPAFSVDGTVFISQHQGPSVRPPVALVSHDRGESWEYHPSGIDNVGRFTSATVSPRYVVDNTVFMTNEDSGVYRSTDGGHSWLKANEGLATLRLSHSVTGLDGNGQVVLFVSGISGGLYRSTDSGTSWESVLAPNVVVSAIGVSPDFTVDGTVLVGDPSGALFISVDAGQTFSQRGALTGVGVITRVKFAPEYVSNGEIYVGTSVGLYYSHDAAQRFVKLDAFGTHWVSALALSTNYRTDSTVFVATPTQGVFKSTDAGRSWALHGTGKPFSDQTNYHFMDLEVSDSFADDGVVFLGTFEGLFRSVDGGLNWSELETRPPSLVMGVALSPEFARDGLILVSTYGGGFYVSHDAGANWNVSNLGITFTYTYQVATASSAGAGPLLFANHVNYVLLSSDDGATWTRKVASGANSCVPSAMGVSPAFASDQTIFLGCRNDGLKVTRDGGDTWQTLISAEQLSTGVVTSIEPSPDFAADSTLFIADWRGYFLRSQDAGNSWKIIVNGLPGRWKWYGGTSIAVSPDFPNDNFVVASSPRGFYGSFDAGDNWWPTPDTASPVASGTIEFVGISPDFKQDQTILASVRGEGLFRSSDGGVSWQRVATASFDNGYDVKGFAFSPNFAQDGVVIGYGGEHLLRSADRGDTFDLFDIPFVRHEESRDQSVAYLGNWTQVISDDASAMTLRVAPAGGKQSALSFWGTGVTWIGVRAQPLGIAEVYIDRSLAAMVDQYNPTTLWRESLYSVQGLPLGWHQIHIVTTRDKNPDATAAWTTIDAFDVTR